MPLTIAIKKEDYMAKIAVIIDNKFEESEYVEPAKAFKEAGHELSS